MFQENTQNDKKNENKNNKTMCNYQYEAFTKYSSIKTIKKSF